MRTTVDLPPLLHRRARELAERRGESLSAVLAELAGRGLAQLEGSMVISTDARTGLPVIEVGRPVTTADVHDALDDE